MNKPLFYKLFRKEFGRLQQAQVDVIETVLSSKYDEAQKAYILATAWHESKLRPIKEIRASTRQVKLRKLQDRYWHTGFYGRGLIQLTWDLNYKTMGERIGEDLLGNPDKALEPIIATKILLEWFDLIDVKGKDFRQVVSNEKHDFLFARRYVNIVDKADLIADYAEKILKMIKDANSTVTV